MRNLIKKILKEEVNKKYPKPTPKVEQLVYRWLDEYFEGAQMYDDEVFKNYRYDFQFCKNGREIAELWVYFENNDQEWEDKRPMSERKLKETTLYTYPVLINELLSDIPIRKNYLIYLIEEWFEDTYLDKIQSMLNRNDLHLDNVSVSQSKKEGDVCVPPIKKSDDDTIDDMIDYIALRTLFKRDDLLKREDEDPGFIEKLYLQKLRNDEMDRVRGE